MKKKDSFEPIRHLICLGAVSRGEERERALGRLRVGAGPEECALFKEEQQGLSVRDRKIKLSARLQSQASFIRMA